MRILSLELSRSSSTVSSQNAARELSPLPRRTPVSHAFSGNAYERYLGLIVGRSDRHDFAAGNYLGVEEWTKRECGRDWLNTMAECI